MKTLFRTFPIKIQPRQLATEIKRNHTIIPPSLSLSFSPLTLEHALVKELLTSVQKFRDKFKIGTEFPPLYFSKPQKEKKKNGGSQINWNLRGDFYFYFAQLHCAQIRLSPIARYREGNLYKEERGRKFRADMIFLSIFQPISILLPSSPYRFLRPFLWKLAVISIHTFSFTLFIDDSRFPWANIGSRKGRIGRIFSISRQKLLENGYKTSGSNKGNSAMIYKSGRKVWIFGCAEIDDKGSSIDKETQG